MERRRTEAVSLWAAYLVALDRARREQEARCDAALQQLSQGPAATGDTTPKKHPPAAAGTLQELK